MHSPPTPGQLYASTWRDRLRPAGPVLSRPWTQHALVFAVLAGIAALMYGGPFGFPPVIPPFNGDNVISLDLAAQRDPDFFSNPPEHYYRPLAYFTMWLQYQVHDLRLPPFFAANIALWIACALCAYALVYRHTRVSLAAGAAAVAMLVDDRATTALIWIVERQSTLACLFGGAALLLAYRLPAPGGGRSAALAGLVLLLLAAGLSKEYGLAFAAAVAALAVTSPRELRRPLLAAVVAVGAGYALLRWGVGQSSLAGESGFCERMGYGGKVRDVCYGDLDTADRLLQHVWNVGATFVGTLLPPLFGGNGELLAPDFLAGTLGVNESFSLSSVVFPAVVSALAVVAWVTRPRAALPFLALVVVNALLSLALYRDRNQLVGIFGVYVSAGIGLLPALRMLEAWARGVATRLSWRPSRLALLIPLIAALVVGVGSHARAVRDNIEGEKADYAQRDPCDSIEPESDDPLAVGPDIPERLRAKFDLVPPTCPRR